jgi:hypothetical protein
MSAQFRMQYFFSDTLTASFFFPVAVYYSVIFSLLFYILTDCLELPIHKRSRRYLKKKKVEVLP